MLLGVEDFDVAKAGVLHPAIDLRRELDAPRVARRIAPSDAAVSIGKTYA